MLNPTVKGTKNNIFEFIKFSKIPRLSRDIIITEKIDGTNAQIAIGENGEFKVGCRTRWITPENDNYGFALWASQHKDELLKLGPGRHFGEWWGSGIQRGYDLFECRFSLFNILRWGPNRDVEKYPVDKPACCHVVPILWQGTFDTGRILEVMDALKVEGSHAVSGFMNPEGIVVFHIASGHLYKKTFFGDDKGKGHESDN